MDPPAHESSAWPKSLLFASTVFLSAFLLFQVQPLISNYILPWFGGSPAVWTNCLLFFQTVLFAGYAYAHWTERFLTPRRQSYLHLGLIVLACIALPIAPAAGWKPLGDESPVLRILLLLAASVGMPYFLLSTTGPLLQVWFSRAFPTRSPYRLYALSNLGSLLALLSYPFLVEPAWDVDLQAKVWSIAFVVFAILCGAAAWMSRRLERTASLADVADNTAANGAPGWLVKGAWLFLPALASMTLLAVTNHVCQDVAPVPFLWVVPLSLYLISFILTFDHERWYWRLPFGLIAVFGIYAAVGVGELQDWKALQWLSESWDVVVGNPARQWKPEETYARELLAHFVALFAICVICHGELVRLKPAPKYLTSFYLMISAGGALGGIFVSVVAPQIFTTFFEWKICMCASFILAMAVICLPARRQSSQVGPVAEAVAKQRNSLFEPVNIVQLLGLIAAAVVLFDICRLLDLFTPGSDNVLAQHRNFFGAVRVVDIDADKPTIQRRELLNGRILHGVQFVSEERRHWPTTYYSEESGVGRSLGYYRRYNNMRVGAVGLGVGTLATYGLPGQTFRFYEINPKVPELAEEHFSFLKNAKAQGARIEIVLGDARLSLEKELAESGSQKFDLLVLDAFSGDAIPNHLLTREAFEIYMPHLAQGGAIAVHASNRYLDLTPVVYGLAKHFNLQSVRIKSTKDNTKSVSSAEWIVLSKNRELVQVLRESVANQDEIPENPLLWTDRHHNVFDILD